MLVCKAFMRILDIMHRYVYIYKAVSIGSKRQSLSRTLVYIYKGVQKGRIVIIGSISAHRLDYKHRLGI